MVNCTVLESFAKVRRSSPDNIKMEIAFNLLEDLLTLYIRARTFSFVKDKVQAFKIRIKISKQNKINISKNRHETIHIIHPLKMCKITMKKGFFCPIACVVYKFSCGRCNATYYSETCRHLSVRVGEHSGVSPLTGKKSKSKRSTAVKDHMLFCDHIVSIDDFKILPTSDSDFHVKVKERLLISRDEPILKKNETSLPFYLFD